LSLGRFRGYRHGGRSIGLNYLIAVNSSFAAAAQKLRVSLNLATGPRVPTDRIIWLYYRSLLKMIRSQRFEGIRDG